MTSKGAPPDLAQVYERYTKMLLSAVRALERRGVDVNSEDAIELVHDFYIEALPRILQLHDSSRSRLSGYLYRAFLRFLRPRIARERRWKEILVPLDEAVDEAAVEGHRDEERRLAEVVERLPSECRDVLGARLDGQSDRQIAKCFGITRYAVRQRLAEALGRAAIGMDHAETIRADLRPFAIRLWRDEIPLMVVADELNLSRQKAWKRYRTLIRTLGATVSALDDVRSGRKKTHD